jgi:hypothetical protein
MACSQDFIEGRDYTVENGLFVFTAYYLKNRGYCCKNGCKNCPWGFHGEGADIPKQEDGSSTRDVKDG